MDTPLIVQTTIETKQNGQTLANILLENRLVACAQLSGPIESRYWWDSTIENSPEFILTLKTFSSLYEDVEKILLEHHPYDVPEIIATRLEKVSSGYLSWMRKELSR